MAAEKITVNNGFTTKEKIMWYVAHESRT